MLQITSGGTVKTTNHNVKNIKRLSREIYDCIFSRQPHLILKDRIAFLNHYDIFRILANVKTHDIVTKDILLRNIYKLEQQSVGASIILLSLLCDKKIEIESVEKLSKDTLLELLGSVDVSILRTTMIEALANSSVNTNLLVDSSSRESYILYSNTLEFPITQINEFGNKHTFDEAKFILYDGVVERISQLEKVLNKNIIEKIPTIILAKGFGYEVVSTLLHNFKNKITTIVPITSNVDWSSEFIIKDLAACVGVGCDDIKINDTFLKNVRIENNKLFLQDDELLKNSQNLINKIRKESERLQGLEEFVEKRLRFLASDKIEIFVGDEFGDSKDIVMDRLKYVSRLIIACKSREVIRLKIDNHTHFCSYDAIKKATEVKKSILNLLSTSNVVKNVG